MVIWRETKEIWVSKLSLSTLSWSVLSLWSLSLANRASSVYNCSYSRINSYSPCWIVSWAPIKPLNEGKLIGSPCDSDLGKVRPLVHPDVLFGFYIFFFSLRSGAFAGLPLILLSALWQMVLWYSVSNRFLCFYFGEDACPYSWTTSKLSFYEESSSARFVSEDSGYFVRQSPICVFYRE